MDTLGNLFRPNQDIHQLLAILSGLSIATIAVCVVWLIVYLKRNRTARTHAWNRFRILAKRYLLTRQEIAFLQSLIKASNITQPTQVLTTAEIFEKLVKIKDAKGKRYEKCCIRSLRDKLFARTLGPHETIRSTHSIPVGTRFLVQYTDYPDEALWAHLVDVDHHGMIVVVPSSHRIPVPLRLDTQLEITAFVPQRDPIEFRTWVKSVIPGQRKMFVLGHSNFVVDRKGLDREARLVGPQQYRQALSRSKSDLPASLTHV